MIVASPVAEPRSLFDTTLNMSRRFSSCLILATVCARACSQFDETLCLLLLCVCLTLNPIGKLSTVENARCVLPRFFVPPWRAWGVANRGDLARAWCSVAQAYQHAALWACTGRDYSMEWTQEVKFETRWRWKVAAPQPQRQRGGAPFFFPFTCSS